MASLDTTAGSLMDSWPQWRDKVIQFSKLESATRPALKQLLGDLESKDSVACLDGECFNTVLSMLKSCL